MRSKAVHRILDRTPLETKIFVRKYAELVLRINQVLEAKGINRKELAEKLGKRPSEISKWLNGDHNLTLKTIARLEAELGVELWYVPQLITLPLGKHSEVSFTVIRNNKIDFDLDFTPMIKQEKTGKPEIIKSAS